METNKGTPFLSSKPAHWGSGGQSEKVAPMPTQAKGVPLKYDIEKSVGLLVLFIILRVICLVSILVIYV